MIVADRLTELHFAAQDEATVDLEVVEVARLDPFLRGLLFTDGTVSRALEAQTLTPVALEAVEQTRTPAPTRAARYLDVPAASECIRRRVVMTIAGPSPSVWAESYVVPGRLPEDFVGVLDGSSHGIGGSLRQLRLESWRDLLWFGLGEVPSWSEDEATTTTLTRVYRIITNRLPALLISEAFAVEMHLGEYRLAGASEPLVDPTSASRPRPRTRIVVDDRSARGGAASD